MSTLCRYPFFGQNSQKELFYQSFYGKPGFGIWWGHSEKTLPNMSGKKINTGVQPEDDVQKTLLQKLEENRRRLQALDEAMVEKSKQLDRVTAQIDGLNKLYPGSKRRGWATQLAQQLFKYIKK